jgi:hypothetical protein
MTIKTTYYGGIQAWGAAVYAEDGRRLWEIQEYHTTEKGAINAAKRWFGYCPPGSTQPEFRK